MMRTVFTAVLFSALFVLFAHNSYAAVPAFPEAEGFGAQTIGGRGGRVIEVTNLNDEGSGSLRQALEASGPRVVVFRVGGTIKVTGQIHITNPYLTVAGHTAPGDGITIRGGVFNIGTHDVIVRGIRVRMGDEPAQYPPDERDSLGIVNLYSGQDVYNVILDHVSVSWGVDENLSIWSAPNLYGGKSFHDITVQWSIISEGLYNSIHPKGGHSMGLLVGDRSKRISVHHNLFAHNNQRNPLMKGATETEVINNYIYDWGGSPTAFSDSEGSGVSYAHIINNFYKKGPSTRSNIYGVHFSSATVGTKAYVQGNIGPTRPNDSLPEWDIVSAGNTQFQAADLIFTPSGITTQSADQAQNLVVQKAGVTHPARDAVDERILFEAQNGTGSIIDSQTQVGGWPVLSAGTAYADSDHDGMSDEWEQMHFGSLAQGGAQDSSSDADADGYTDLEEFLNGTNPSVSYYVDCAGNDSNTGTSESQAWKSLSRASAALLDPGDQLLFKRGCTWEGSLHLAKSGTAASPIRIDVYGTAAANPTFRNPHGSNNSAVVDIDGSYIRVHNLTVEGVAPGVESGCENNPVGYIIGFRLNTGSHNITIADSRARGHYAGVYIQTGSHHNTIIRNEFVDNTMMSPLDRGGSGDAGAFGVLIWGDDNEIAYNTISGHDACSYDYVRDGGAIELYGGKRNTIHHNRAHDNDAFTELGDSKTSDTVFAYNLVTSTHSQSIFLNTRGLGDQYGPVYRTKAYNNTVYLTGADSQAVVCSSCSSDILTLKNNILWAEKKALYASAPFIEKSNIFWNTAGSPLIQGITPDATSKVVDPWFVNPSMGDFHIDSLSLAINAGSVDVVAEGFTSDLDDVRIPNGSHVDIGAYEFVSTGQCLKQGDIDCNNTVNIFDLSRILSVFGQSVTTREDINRDGTVSLFDLSILLSNFGL